MRKKILVIEDERDIAELIRLHLGDLDFAVTVAGDGSAGLHKALTGFWDLIILDLRLPGIDGLEICRRVRQRPYAIPALLSRPFTHRDESVQCPVNCEDSSASSSSRIRSPESSVSIRAWITD